MFGANLVQTGSVWVPEHATGTNINEVSLFFINNFLGVRVGPKSIFPTKSKYVLLRSLYSTIIQIKVKY